MHHKRTTHYYIWYHLVYYLSAIYRVEQVLRFGVVDVVVISLLQWLSFSTLFWYVQICLLCRESPHNNFYSFWRLETFYIENFFWLSFKILLPLAYVRPIKVCFKSKNHLFFLLYPLWIALFILSYLLEFLNLSEWWYRET